jgi:hypothetical protein
VTVRLLEGLEWDFDAAPPTIRVAVEVSTLSGWRIELVTRGLERREVVSLTMTPLDEVPPGGITRRALDRINLGAILGEIRAEHDRLDERGFHMSPALKRSVGKALAAQPHPGPRGFPDKHYAVIAADYVDRVVIRGEPLARFAKRHHMSAARIRNILTTARDKELLSKAPPGRVGGELTDKARQLLEHEGK